MPSTASVVRRFFLVALLGISAPIQVVHAQVSAQDASRPQASPQLEPHNNQVLPCSSFLNQCQAKLATCNAQSTALQQQLTQCQQHSALAHDQLATANAEIAVLRPQAALPVCSDRHQWIHAVLPTVQCGRYACGATPFSCKLQCNSKLDCAPGMDCTANGNCKSLP